MRKSSRLSPSQFAKFEKNRSEYYLTYCASTRIEREPQSKPASVGSAFDAYVKAELIERVFGDKTFEALFESQVSDEHKDFALEAGAYTMACYRHSGAFDDLLELLDDALEEPQFEFDAETVVEGIPIAGKPDCRFIHRNGAHVILDWKVNGYCGKSSTSPKPGFIMCRDGLAFEKPSRSDGKPHKKYEPIDFKGILINKFNLEEVSIDWADQLSMYGWMMGEPVGGQDFIVCIDQIVGKGQGDGSPALRVAQHKSRISAEYQYKLMDRLHVAWTAIQEGHIFNEDSIERNEDLCRMLEYRAMSTVSDGTPEGDFFADCVKIKSFYKGR